MSESFADAQMVMSRLIVMENQLHQLRDWVSAQFTRVLPSAPTSLPYITRTEAILSGEPIIQGTRTPVRAVVEHWKFGDTPEEIARKLPHLRLAQIFDALGYYDDHRAEVERYIALNRLPTDD